MIKQLAITAGAAVATAGAATAGAKAYDDSTGISDARATERDARAIKKAYFSEEDGRNIATVSSIPADAFERVRRPDAIASLVAPALLAGGAALGTGHLLKLGSRTNAVLATAAFLGTGLLRVASEHPYQG